MRIGRVVIIPAILILSVAGSVTMATEISAAAAQAPAAHVQQTSIIVGPMIRYHN